MIPPLGCFFCLFHLQSFKSTIKKKGRAGFGVVLDFDSPCLRARLTAWHKGGNMESYHLVLIRRSLARLVFFSA